jgi:methionine biosynthesis protein MetW
MQDFYEGRKTDLKELDARLKLVASLIDRVDPKRLLDVACGRGALLLEAMRRHPDIQVAGCDISEDSVAKTRAASGLDVVVADVQQRLPFDDESFDCVVFGEVIEHLVDPDQALLNISRVLTKGGALIVTTPNLASWFNRLLLLCGVQPIATETSLHVNLGRAHPALGQWKPVMGHLKVFVYGALKEMLEANGYTVERVAGAPFPQPSPMAPFDRVISKAPRLASNFVVLARNGRTLQTNYKRLPGWLE